MKRYLLLGLLCLVLLGGGLQLLWTQFSDYGRVLQENWGLTLPDDAGCRLVYRAETEPSFLGDGLRYHIFSCEDGAAVDGMLSWLTAAAGTNFYASGAEAVQAWLDEMQVPAEQRPTFSDCRFWYASQPDLSEIVVLWDRAAARLYVAESFL